MILSDNETKIDLLNTESIAKTILGLIRERPDHPITVGVHGDWGAGKSSILEMLEASLESEEKIVCLKFNGWRFQGFEDAKIALMEGVVEALLEKRPLLTKTRKSVKDVLHRIDMLKAAKKAGGLLGAGAAFYVGHHQLGMMALASSLGGSIMKPENFNKEKVSEVVDGVKEIFKEKKEHESSVPEDIAAFRKAFDEMLKDANIDQLIVLIDDLDRCLPKTAIETLEAVRLFIFNPKTAFVIAADEAMIEYSVREHFPDLPETTGPQSYARAYLEKLIQVPFRIPALGQTEVRIYVTLLLIGAQLPEGEPGFGKLLEQSREHLRRPWLGGALTADAVKEALGETEALSEDIQNALLISEQIGPILASGTSGNPRQVKRFLNTLLLRQASSIARGFGADIKLPILAKLMLVERFIPSMFAQIASSAANAPGGVCHEIQQLEALMDDVGPTEDETKDKAKKSSAAPKTNPILEEWQKSDAAKDWAKLGPRIGGEDLRPYLFVAKDRKDFFGGITLLGRTAVIAEKLLGTKFVVRKEESNLRQLAAPEAAQVFEILRGHIVATDSFKKAPAGADGIEVLLRAHPELQPALLDFFEYLPADRLGGWVCAGWADVIKDPPQIQRYEQLIEQWAQKGTTELRAVAAARMKVRTQGDR